MTKSVRYEVSFHRGSFSCISPLLWPKIAFVIPRTSLYRGSLYLGSTVLWFASRRFDYFSSSGSLINDVNDENDKKAIALE